MASSLFKLHFSKYIQYTFKYKDKGKSFQQFHWYIFSLLRPNRSELGNRHYSKSHLLSSLEAWFVPQKTTYNNFSTETPSFKYPLTVMIIIQHNFTHVCFLFSTCYFPVQIKECHCLRRHLPKNFLPWLIKYPHRSHLHKSLRNASCSLLSSSFDQAIKGGPAYQGSNH